LLSTLNPATAVAEYGRDGEPADQLGITAQAILDQKAGNQPSVDAAVSIFDFDLPVETHEAMCKLETNLHNNPAVATELKAFLSLVGSNKDLKSVIRAFMRNIMSKNLRTTYVVRKATKGKNVFIKHKLISKLVLSKVSFYKFRISWCNNSLLFFRLHSGSVWRKR
jgi:hypothetical protein